jgi:hypothetical protein
MTATTKLQPTLASTTCPYCGVDLGSVGDASNRCFSCRGLLDPLSRQASQNDMGPWFIRDDKMPFRPGCSFEVLRALALKGRISPATIIRGPATRQFWMSASHTPGIGHLFGSCHSCGTECSPTDVSCDECHSSFVIESNRQHLGLGPIHLLPGVGAAAPPQTRLQSLVGDSIDEEQLIAASATTLPREELPEAMAELRSSRESSRRGDAGLVTTVEMRSLEHQLTNARLLALITALLAGLCIAATILLVLDVRQDLGLGLARKLQGRNAATPSEPTTPVDNLSAPISSPSTLEPTSIAPDEPEQPRPRTRGVAGSSNQPAVLPSTPPPTTTPGPHDKPTPDGEKVPSDSRWDQVADLLKKGDKEAIVKALGLVEALEQEKLPPPATRPDLARAVRTKAALMTLTPSNPDVPK